MDVDAEDVSKLDPRPSSFRGPVAAAGAPRTDLVFVGLGPNIVETTFDGFGTQRDDGKGGTVGATVERRHDDASGFAAVGSSAIARRPFAVVRDDAVLRARQDAGFPSVGFGGKVGADVVFVDAIGPAILADDVAALHAPLDAAAVVEGVEGVLKATVRDAREIVDHLVDETRGGVPFQFAVAPRRLVPAQPLAVVIADFEAGPTHFGSGQLSAVMGMGFPLAGCVDALDRPDLNATVAASGGFAIAPSPSPPGVGGGRMNGNL